MPKNDPWPDIQLRPRPSRLNQIIHHCPGSLKAEQGLAEIQTKTSSALTDPGDDRHRAMQTWARGDKDAEERYIELDVEDRSIVRMWQRQIVELLVRNGHMAAFSPEGLRLDEQVQIYCEYRLGPFMNLPIQEDSGDGDLILVFNEDMYIFDFKGRSEQPDPEEHYQLLTYMVGGMNRFQRRQCTIAVGQPELDMATYTVQMRMIEAWRKKILALIEEMQKAEDKRIPSPQACRFCRAFATQRCPETVQSLVKIRQDKELVLNLPRNVAVFLVANFKAIEERVSALKKTIRADKENDPSSWPEFRMNKPTIRKFITADEDALELVMKEYKLTAEECFSVCKVSRGKLVDLLAMRWRVSPEDAEVRLDALLRDFGFLGTTDQAGAIVPVKLSKAAEVAAKMQKK